MLRARTSILKGVFPDFVREYLATAYPKNDVPQWARDALAHAGITLAP
jgi:hypothetical protein